jgi:hypothetical protein
MSSACTESKQNVWLTSCGWALHEVRRAETPHPKDAWEFNTDVLFKAQADLSDALAEECSELMAEPSRVPANKSLWPSGWPPPGDTCTQDEHLQWLRSCERDALDLIGLTRADLLTKFREEGGLSTYQERTYIHRHCMSLKVRVQFSLTHEEAESPDDVIDSASPYVGCEMFD